MIVFRSNVIKIKKKHLRGTKALPEFLIGVVGQTVNLWRSKFFEKKDFFGYKDIVKWMIKSWGLGWHVIWILLKGKNLNQKFKFFPKLKLGDVVSKLV